MPQTRLYGHNLFYMKVDQWVTRWNSCPEQALSMNYDALSNRSRDGHKRSFVCFRSIRSVENYVV